MPNPMTAATFKKVMPRDLTNEACRNEIEDALRERERLVAIVAAVRELCDWEEKYGAVKFALPGKVLAILDAPPATIGGGV